MDDVYTVDFQIMPTCKHSRLQVCDEAGDRDFVCDKYLCFCCANYRCADYEPRGEREGDNG